MKLISKIYCWLFGHDMVPEGFNLPIPHDVARSYVGAYRCMRCGKVHQYQYDL